MCSRLWRCIIEQGNTKCIYKFSHKCNNLLNLLSMFLNQKFGFNGGVIILKNLKTFNMKLKKKFLNSTNFITALNADRNKD
ncbi:hypothetical protein BpHYR1_011474 [Brachionus plicatilis]|uniref:Uncharacterized protein n=1 Tax=Brachionus plicatilis TaxID=10195 RepID=A0A3M7QEH8_BRAPC|nr:hypothetical protein BpHYR1_011474 [Brachionus plicatilis]